MYKIHCSQMQLYEPYKLYELYKLFIPYFR